jgi:lysophospholipase L1-like esterase
MKKLVTAICFCLLASITVGQSKVYDTIQYAKDYYQTRLTLFQSEPIVKAKTVFLGNSITEFGDWQKLLNDTTIINRGIAGDNTFGVLKRLNEVIKLKPSKLFIKIGINDISQNIPIEIIAKNISFIIERVKVGSPKTKIYIHSVLPTNDNVRMEYPDAYQKNDKVILLNEAIQKEAKKQKVVYIDIHSIFKDKFGQLNEKYAVSDGLHLNDAGYQLWANYLKAKKYL